MQRRRDLVLEAQGIIDAYVRKNQMDELVAGYEFMREYSKMKSVKERKRQRSIFINYVLAISSLLLINMIIYLVFSLHFLK